MPELERLISTKLRPPFIRQDLVVRPDLQDRLRTGTSCPLTLVVAPAGFGKTTLVAASLADFHMPVAWLSLDKDDNQFGRFMTYMVAALQTIDGRIGNEVSQLLEGMHPAPGQAVLASLINDLDAAGNEIVLVLDDFQFISSQAVQEAVAFLLAHCPKTFHLLIATRSDPALPLARLRAKGQMFELRTFDLRFSLSEAAHFLNNVRG
jgi:LuxR family maltose regulon positive regulatory protein